MIAFALVLTWQATGWCHSSGPTVRCLLPPPIAARSATAPVMPEPPPPPPSPKPRDRPRPADRHARPRPRPNPRPVLDAAGIARHVDSLVAIGDCTGARTFLNGVGTTAQADSVFGRCVGPGAIVPGSAPQGSHPAATVED